MMLRSAAGSVARRGLAHRVHLGFGDATSFDAQELFAVASFDRIFMSYTLSMMPDWQGALRHALRLLAPHGSLHVVDFGACERLPPAFKRGLDAWLRRFSVTPRTALVPELHALARDHACQLNTASPFRGYAIYAVLRKSGTLHASRRTGAERHRGQRAARTISSICYRSWRMRTASAPRTGVWGYKTCFTPAVSR